MCSGAILRSCDETLGSGVRFVHVPEGTAQPMCCFEAALAMQNVQLCHSARVRQQPRCTPSTRASAAERVCCRASASKK